MTPKPLKIAEIFLLIVVVIGGGWWLMKKPVPVTQMSPMPTATVDASSWQTYRNEEYGSSIEIPKDWKVGCSSDQSRKPCMFCSPQDIKDAEQHPTRSSLPPSSLTIAEVVVKSTLPDFGEKRSDVR